MYTEFLLVPPPLRLRCRLRGPITEDMFFLPQLTALNLAANSLTGTVAPSLG